MNHTAKLAKLQQAAAKERTAAREAHAEAEAAQHTATAARDQLVDAHAGGTDIRRAEQALSKARDKAEGAAIRAEAATRRVERAEADANRYEVTHADDLIAELEPQARAAAERLAEAARNLHDAHTEWHAVAAQVGALIRHLPGVHSPPDHAPEPVAREVRNFLRQSGEIAPPLPTRPNVRRIEMPEVAA